MTFYATNRFFLALIDLYKETFLALDGDEHAIGVCFFIFLRALFARVTKILIHKHEYYGVQEVANLFSFSLLICLDICIALYLFTIREAWLKTYKKLMFWQ